MFTLIQKREKGLEKMNKDKRPTYSGVLYIGSYGSEEDSTIHVCNFNGETGEISVVQDVNGIEAASYLTIHPNGQHLYAASETEKTGNANGGSVSTFHIEQATGLLAKSSNRALTLGAHPCYISTDDDGKVLFAANYTGGNVTMLPINEQGELTDEACMQQNEGELGPNASRQEKPHAHCIIPMPDSPYACAVDLGIDAIVVYRYDTEQLTLTPHSQTEVKGGAGPRHLIFHPALDVSYVMNELDSTITLLKTDKELGELTVGQNITTLPEGFEGSNYPADIHLSPSGLYLYGSNRGHDSIVVFSVDQASGDLSPIQHISSGGEFPRNFVISPDGRYLLSANQNTGNIVVFHIDEESGLLTKTDQALQLKSPVCLKFGQGNYIRLKLRG